MYSDQEYLTNLKNTGIDSLIKEKTYTDFVLKRFATNYANYYYVKYLGKSQSDFQLMQLFASKKHENLEERKQESRNSLYTEEVCSILDEMFSYYKKYYQMEISRSLLESYLQGIDYTKLGTHLSFSGYVFGTAKRCIKSYAKIVLGISDNEFQRIETDSVLYQRGFELYSDYVHFNNQIEDLELYQKYTNESAFVIAKKYAESHGKMNDYNGLVETEKMDSLIHQSQDNPYQRIIDRIYFHDDTDMIIYTIINQHLNLQKLYVSCEDYVFFHFSSENVDYEQILNHLQDQVLDIRIQIESMNEQNLSSDYFNSKVEDKSNKMITSFISTNLTIDEFIQANHICYSSFRDMLEIVKEKNTPLYQQYCDLAFEHSKEGFSKMTHFVHMILNYVKNGIPNYEDSSVSDFTLFDYYSMAGTNFSDIFSFLKKAKIILNSDDYSLLERFFYYHSLKYQVMDDETDLIMDGTYTVEGKEISLENKEKLLSHMRRKNMPITLELFLMGYRQLQNTSFFEENTKKI